jgi:hypothetical protein
LNGVLEAMLGALTLLVATLAAADAVRQAKYLREMRRIRRALEFILRKEGKQRKGKE